MAEIRHVSFLWKILIFIGRLCSQVSIMWWHATFKRNCDTCGTSHWSSTGAVSFRSTRNSSPNYVDDIGVESNDEVGRPTGFNGEREYPSPSALTNEGKEPRERQRLTSDEFLQQKERVRLHFIIRTYSHDIVASNSHATVVRQSVRSCLLPKGF